MSMSAYRSVERQVALLTGDANGIRAAGAGAAVSVNQASSLHRAATVVAGIEQVGGSASASQPDAPYKNRLEATSRGLLGRLVVPVTLFARPRNNG